MNAHSNAVSTDECVLVRCGCGAVHTPDEWETLPIVGWMARLELRNCHCGSTLSLRIESWRELMDKVLHATLEPEPAPVAASEALQGAARAFRTEARFVAGESAYAVGFRGGLERAAAGCEIRARIRRKVPLEQTCAECGYYDLEAGLCKDPFLKDPAPEAATKPACEFFRGEER